MIQKSGGAVSSLIDLLKFRLMPIIWMRSPSGTQSPLNDTGRASLTLFCSDFAPRFSIMLQGLAKERRKYGKFVCSSTLHLDPDFKSATAESAPLELLLVLRLRAIIL